MSIDQQRAQAGSGHKASGGPRRRERLTVIAGVLVTVLAIAGIGVIVAGEDEQPAVLPSAVPSVAPSVAPSAAPAVQTPQDLLAAEAKAAYVNFVRVDDEIGQGGYDDPARYAEVAITPERDQLIKEARQFDDVRQIGNTSVVSMTVQDVVVGDGAIRPKVKLLVCRDVSGVDGVGADGRSVVPADRQVRNAAEVLLERFEPGTKGAERGGFYVAEVKQLLDQTTC
jgi:hypothetical protein